MAGGRREAKEEAMAEKDRVSRAVVASTQQAAVKVRDEELERAVKDELRLATAKL
jgi:hypothetical protein